MRGRVHSRTALSYSTEDKLGQWIASILTNSESFGSQFVREGANVE